MLLVKGDLAGVGKYGGVERFYIFTFLVDTLNRRERVRESALQMLTIFVELSVAIQNRVISFQF